MALFVIFKNALPHQHTGESVVFADLISENHHGAKLHGILRGQRPLETQGLHQKKFNAP
jgi:hypothetical protein